MFVQSELAIMHVISVLLYFCHLHFSGVDLRMVA